MISTSAEKLRKTPDDSPWQPIATAPTDGTLCEIRFRDLAGTYEAKGPHFLHEDGFWYRVDPPVQIIRKPVAWRPCTTK